MRFADLLGLSLSALWQQKVRVVLTTLGVLFGAFVLTTSLSVGEGVQAVILREYQRFGELRLIDVLPPRLDKTAQPPSEKLIIKGKMSEAKRLRLQKEITLRWQRQAYFNLQSGLSQDIVDRITCLEHVHSVKPLVNLPGRLQLANKNKSVHTLGVLPDDKILPERLVAGQMISAEDDRGALVSEFTLYQLGVTDDEQVEKLLGKALTLEILFSEAAQEFTVRDLLQVNPGGLTPAEEKALHKIADRLPEALARLGLDPADEALLKKLTHKGKHVEKPLIVTEALTLRGVLAAGSGRPKNMLWGWAYDGVDVALPQRTAESLYFKYPRFQKYGFERLQVEVDEIDHVKTVNEQIKAMGVDTYCLAEVLDKEQFTYLLVFASMTIVAGIALLVAALGITNTMLMSVLERVREIGIMKAVGARELHLRLLFLVEGGLLGLVGGLLGLGLGWAASFPANAWVKSLVEGRLDLKLDRSLFAFPPWLVVGVPLFTWLVTTLAAYYPARRAARIDPIQALRHE